jgi:hypothetical protein
MRVATGLVAAEADLVVGLVETAIPEAARRPGSCRGEESEVVNGRRVSEESDRKRDEVVEVEILGRVRHRPRRSMASA